MNMVVSIALAALLRAAPSAPAQGSLTAADVGLGLDRADLLGAMGDVEQESLAGLRGTSGDDCRVRPRRARRAARRGRRGRRAQLPRRRSVAEEEATPVADAPIADAPGTEPSVQLAAPSYRKAPQTARLWVAPTLVSWVDGIGVGAWSSYNWLPSGLFSSLADALDIEAGAVVAARQVNGFRYYSVSPLAGVRWRYSFSPDWDVFASVRGGAAIRSAAPALGYGTLVTAGLLWKLSDKGRVRVEVAYPGAVLAGVSLPFGDPFGG